MATFASARPDQTEAAGALPGSTRLQDIPVRKAAIRHVPVGLLLRTTGTAPTLRAALRHARARVHRIRSRPAPPVLAFARNVLASIRM